MFLNLVFWEMFLGIQDPRITFFCVSAHRFMDHVVYGCVLAAEGAWYLLKELLGGRGYLHEGVRPADLTVRLKPFNVFLCHLLHGFVIFIFTISKNIVLFANA